MRRRQCRHGNPKLGYPGTHQEHCQTDPIGRIDSLKPSAEKTHIWVSTTPMVHCRGTDTVTANHKKHGDAKVSATAQVNDPIDHGRFTWMLNHLRSYLAQMHGAVIDHDGQSCDTPQNVKGLESHGSFTFDRLVSFAHDCDRNGTGLASSSNPSHPKTATRITKTNWHHIAKVVRSRLDHIRPPKQDFELSIELQERA